MLIAKPITISWTKKYRLILRGKQPTPYTAPGFLA